MKFQIWSSCNSVKADVAVLAYVGKPIQVFYQTLPVCILTSPGIIGTPRNWPKFEKNLSDLIAKGHSVAAIQLEVDFKYQDTPRNVYPLTRIIKNIKRRFPEIKVIVSFLSSTWHHNKVRAGLQDLDVVFTTYYLENDLLESGWAKDCPSKRTPDPLLTFAPITKEIHIVLWGTLGRAWGSYSDGPFIPRMVEKIVRAARIYGLQQIWIELRNDMGRMDYPLPPLGISFPGYWEFSRMGTEILVSPKTDGGKIKPSVKDAQLFKEEWNKRTFVLDGLKF